MTLIDIILKKTLPGDVLSIGTAGSPPPEPEKILRIKNKKKNLKKVDKYDTVPPKVDTSPPILDPRTMFMNFPAWIGRNDDIRKQNIRLLRAIQQTHIERGKVDSRWKVMPALSKTHYYNRVNFLKSVERENRRIYNFLSTTGPKVETTRNLEKDWKRNRRDIIANAQAKFVLFPVDPQELVEDPAFLPPQGFKRPRVRLTLRRKGGCVLGTIKIELLTDVCPQTCKLFLDLLLGDENGYSYVGSHFFRKVPGLYWSGGDVVHDNGFGCYAQIGRSFPIGAENYHFSHTMPGLVSMRVTRNDEVCGIFNIIFKALPQFDLSNVVFGRVIRPCSTFDVMSSLGSALGSQPVIELSASKLHDGRCGHPNTNLKSLIRRKSFHTVNSSNNL